MKTESLQKLHAVKAQLRSGPYAWPGGYPVYFVCVDGGVLSFAAARENWREIVAAHLANDFNSGWLLAGAEINYEDESLFCDHTGTHIESAYGGNDD